MYTLTIANNQLLPTTSKVLDAMRSADAEPSRRDTRALMFYLMRAVSSSPRLRNLIRLRRVGVTSFGWEITSTDEALTDHAAEAQLRCGAAIKSILKYHVDTAAFGSMANELRWDNIEQGWTPVYLKRYLPTEILWNANPDQLVIMPDGNKDQSFMIDPTARPSWILDTDESDVAGGLLRSIIFKAILAKDMEIEWANFNKKVKGLIYAVINEGSTDEEKTAVGDALKNLVQNNYGMFSELTEFKFADVVSSIGAQSFKDFIERLENDMSIAIIGQANTTELPDSGGSRAALTILKMISADISFDDMTRCENMINDQLLTTYYRLNYKEAAMASPFKFRFIVPEDTDIEARANVAVMLAGAGIPVLTSELYNSIGYSKPKTVPDIMFDKTVATPPGGDNGLNNV